MAHQKLRKCVVLMCLFLHKYKAEIAAYVWLFDALLPYYQQKGIAIPY